MCRHVPSMTRARATSRPPSPSRSATFRQWRPAFLAIRQRVQITRREHLRLTRLDDPTSGVDPLAHGRPQTVDSEVRCEDSADHSNGGKAAGGVDQCTDQSRVQKAEILSDFSTPRHADLDLAGCSTVDLDSAPAVERRRVVDSAKLIE